VIIGLDIKLLRIRNTRPQRETFYAHSLSCFCYLNFYYCNRLYVMKTINSQKTSLDFQFSIFFVFVILLPDLHVHKKEVNFFQRSAFFQPISRAFSLFESFLNRSDWLKKILPSKKVTFSDITQLFTVCNVKSRSSFLRLFESMLTN